MLVEDDNPRVPAKKAKHTGPLMQAIASKKDSFVKILDSQRMIAYY